MPSETVSRWVAHSERIIPLIIYAFFATAMTLLALAIMGVGAFDQTTALYRQIVWAAFFPSIYMLIAFMRYRYVVIALLLVLPVAIPGLGL